MTKLIGVLDFETDPFRHERVPKPFCCEIYFGVEHDCNATFWGEHCAIHLANHLRDLPECVVFAHYGGKFDFYFLLPYLDTGTIKIINGRIATVNIGGCELRDSFLIMPFALAKYKKTPIDYDIFEEDVRDYPANRREILAYLHDDCLDTLALLLGFRAHTKDALTIGSAAFASMRRLGIKITKQTDEWHDVRFRPYYYGGRVEVFKPGVIKERVHVIDINSAYPYAMMSEHGHGREYSMHDDLDGVPNRVLDQSFICLLAESTGAFPYRDAKTGRLDFPADGIERTFWITGWEYSAAHKTKTLGKHCIAYVLAPENTINFIPFIDHHFKEREKAKRAGDRINDLAHKTLMNSGYGKFALNPRDFCDYALAEVGDANLKAKGYQFADDVSDNLALWEKPSYKGDGFYDVATAASITGFVRAMLWKRIVKLRTFNTIYYCDTDSIMTNYIDSERSYSGELGGWKYEGYGDKGAFAGKKLYALRGEFGDEKEKKASKGAQLSYKEIVDIARGKAVEWKNPAPSFRLGIPESETTFVKRMIVSTNVKAKRKAAKKKLVDANSPAAIRKRKRILINSGR